MADLALCPFDRPQSVLNSTARIVLAGLPICPLYRADTVSAQVWFPNLTRAYDNNGRCPRQKFIFGIFVNSVDRYLVYLDAEPFVPLLLASYWCLVLKLQLGSVAHSPLLVPPPGMDSPWKSVSCLKIMKVCFAGCLRLICIAMVGLGAPLSRFLEGAPYKFFNK